MQRFKALKHITPTLSLLFECFLKWSTGLFSNLDIRLLTKLVLIDPLEKVVPTFSYRILSSSSIHTVQVGSHWHKQIMCKLQLQKQVTITVICIEQPKALHHTSSCVPVIIYHILMQDQWWLTNDFCSYLFCSVPYDKFQKLLGDCFILIACTYIRSQFVTAKQPGCNNHWILCLLQFQFHSYYKVVTWLLQPLVKTMWPGCYNQAPCL